MSDPSSYKPRLGIDMRVKPPRGDKRRRKPVEEDNDTPCAWPGCKAKGQHRAPVGDGDQKYQMLCLDHVREFNQSWNFFDDMNDEEVEKYVGTARTTGERPTWQFGNESVRVAPDPAQKLKAEKSDKAGAYYRAYQRLNGFRDPYSLIQDAAGPRVAPSAAPRRKLNKIQKNAMDTLDLPETAGMMEVKTRYKELVKRLHPDTNGGDTSTVERLRQVIKAYNVLKASNLG